MDAIFFEKEMSCDSEKPTVSNITSIPRSLHICASNELSKPPEKAIAIEVSLFIACSTAAKTAAFRIPNIVEY